MGIFNGVEILFFILGAMTVLLINGIVFLRKRYPLRWYAGLLAGLGSLLLIFTVAWSVSSIIEGETRSAGMGILVFGVQALVCFALTRQLVVKEMKSAARQKAPVQLDPDLAAHILEVDPTLVDRQERLSA